MTRRSNQARGVRVERARVLSRVDSQQQPGPYPPMSAPLLANGKRRWTVSDYALTAAAIDLLVERGIEGPTLRSLGGRAGYSRGLATHRFGSKAGLFDHVMRTATTRWLTYLQTGIGDR